MSRELSKSRYTVPEPQSAQACRPQVHRDLGRAARPRGSPLLYARFVKRAFFGNDFIRDSRAQLCVRPAGHSSPLCTDRNAGHFVSETLPRRARWSVEKITRSDLRPVRTNMHHESAKVTSTRTTAIGSLSQRINQSARSCPRRDAPSRSPGSLQAPGSGRRPHIES